MNKIEKYYKVVILMVIVISIYRINNYLYIETIILKKINFIILHIPIINIQIPKNHILNKLNIVIFKISSLKIIIKQTQNNNFIKIIK